MRWLLLVLMLTSCCHPERSETGAQRVGLPDGCAGYAVVLRAEGDSATLTLRTPDGRAPRLAFWRGVLSASSSLVTGGAPTLASCGEGCVEAAGDLRGDVCAEALWVERWRWRPRP